MTPDAAERNVPAPGRGRGALGTAKMLLELVKFEHSVFALPYAYIGAVWGATAALGALQPAGSAEIVVFLENDPFVSSSGWPTMSALLWITLVMVGARSFAFIVNRAVDKEIDARNPRTAGRAVPAGLIKAWELWSFAALTLMVYLVAVWQLAPMAQLLWPVPLVAFLVYPYTKRFTWACHMWLGLCLGLAPVGGWVAVGGPIGDPVPWLLGAAVMVWTAGFDIIYATQDLECDRRDGVRSVPAAFGVRAGLVTTRVLHALTVLLLGGAGLLMGAGWPWYLAIAAAGALLAYENSIISAEDLSRVDAAFFTVNGVVAFIVLAGALADRAI